MQEWRGLPAASGRHISDSSHQGLCLARNNNSGPPEIRRSRRRQSAVALSAPHLICEPEIQDLQFVATVRTAVLVDSQVPTIGSQIASIASRETATSSQTGEHSNRTGVQGTRINATLTRFGATPSGLTTLISRATTHSGSKNCRIGARKVPPGGLSDL